MSGRYAWIPEKQKRKPAEAGHLTAALKGRLKFQGDLVSFDANATKAVINLAIT
jgi:hypothetical protein